MKTKAIIIKPTVAVRRPNCRDDNGSCDYSSMTGTLCRLFFEYSTRVLKNGAIKPCDACVDCEKAGRTKDKVQAS